MAAVLKALNKFRAQEVARAEGLSLGEAADLLVELGWHVYSDRMVDAAHGSLKLAAELGRIRKTRDGIRSTAKREVA